MEYKVLEWVFSTLGKAALRKLFDSDAKDRLDRILSDEVSTWVDETVIELRRPDEEDALVPGTFDLGMPSKVDKKKYPALAELGEHFAGGRLPAVEIWEQALLEKWQDVRTQLPEKSGRQPFYNLSEPEAVLHLRRLASRLELRCREDRKLYQVKSLEILDRLDRKAQKSVADDTRAASAILTFLENRGLLYAPAIDEHPADCYYSAAVARDKVTSHIESIDRGTLASIEGHKIVSACQRFMEALRHNRVQHVEEYGALPHNLVKWYWEQIQQLRKDCKTAICNLSTHYNMPLRGKLKEYFGSCC